MGDQEGVYTPSGYIYTLLRGCPHKDFLWHPGCELTKQSTCSSLQAMKIRAHRKLSVNLKLFLETFGAKCHFDISDGTTDEIVIEEMGSLTPSLLEETQAYVEQWGFIPYHFSLAPKHKGKTISGDKTAFTGKVHEIKNFQALQGNFQLILFDGDDKRNYLWKTYTVQEPPSTTLNVTGKIKAIINGTKEEKIILISHCRTKEA